MMKTLIAALMGVILALVFTGASFSENAGGPGEELQLAQLTKNNKATKVKRKSKRK